MGTAVVYFDSIERLARLTELGITEDLLIQAVQRGLTAWASCTPNHPQLFGGISQWAETVCALRETLLPLGWYRSDEGNLPLTINRAGNLAITVATGDESTGQPEESPCTKSSKGPRTASAIAVNRRQLTLFGDIRLLPEDLEQVNGRMTWLLLVHRDMLARELRCELSRPIEIGLDGRVDGWVERIILGRTPFGADAIDISGPSVPQTPEIVVNIAPRL